MPRLQSVMVRFLKSLTAAPHRVMFLPGAAQGVAVMLWWLLELESRAGTISMPVDLALPAPAAHAWLMLYGFFPFFVFGFLFTALPSWLNGPRIERREYLTAGLLQATGAALFYPGLYAPNLAALAVALHLGGVAGAVAALLRSTLQSAPQDKRHAWAALVACGAGLAGEAGYLAWLAANRGEGLGLAVALGLWGWLTPLFLTVCHRMIPWFTSRVLPDYVPVRPYGLLWTMVLCCLAHAGLEAAGHGPWSWPADLVLAGITLWLSLRWGITRTFHVRLLSMLHIGFLWAGLAFALYAADGLAHWAHVRWSPGFAPLHALGIGFFGSMLVGMASRVSLGHSGRKLEADGLTWWLFWLVQLTAVTRMLPDLLPGLPSRLTSLAALFWLIAYGLWALKYAPYFWRPRVDGKPG
jgi:uncharacterized protein involved in response to NO